MMTVNTLIIIVVLCIIIFVGTTYHIYVQRISVHSHSIKKLHEINQKNFFYNDIKIKYVFVKTCESKRSLDRFDYSAYLMQIIYEQLYNFELLIKRIEFNATRYKNYIVEFSSILSNPTHEDAIKAKVPLFFYKKIEPILHQRLKITAPIQKTFVSIYAEYTSPRGRNRYAGNRIFNLFDIKRYINLVKYGIENAKTREFQRSLMTDSLRYNIMKRDNFTCQLCGARNIEGAKLHVDHIFPVSKGGMTVESNLRTLCERCNRGKGAKIETK